MSDAQKHNIRISTVNKMRAMGVQLIPTESVSAPLLNLFGIENVKEVATPICTVVNAAVNKTGWTGYLAAVPQIFPAIADADMIIPELKDMNFDEFVELKDHIKAKLDFEGPADQIEEIAENIAMYVIGIVVEIVKATTLELNAAKPNVADVQLVESSKLKELEEAAAGPKKDKKDK